MKRRILLLVTDLQLGGTPTVVRELAVRFNDEACIQVACLARWGPVADQLVEAGIAVTSLNARNRFDLQIIRPLLERIDADQVDTLFSFLIHANALSALAKVLRPQLRVIHSFQTTQLKPGWHWRLGGICQHAADWVVVPSESVAMAAQDRSQVPEKKIRIIPNAVEAPEMFAMESSGPFFHIGFLGRLDPIKRIDDLIRSLALLPDSFVLSIFGTGSEEQKLRQLTEQLRLSARVTFKGAIQNPWDALAEMNVLVLPSDAEGFGLVLIEAMAVGVPVIATDVSGIRDVVRHARTGLLIPPRDPAALARAIQQISADVSLRERLTTAAKIDVQQRFNWPAVLEQYRQVLLD